MFETIFKKLLVLGFVLISASSAKTQNLIEKTSSNDFASLCSFGIEGSFVGSIDKTPTLFNVVCIDDSRMAMGLSVGPQGDTFQITLINSLVDDDDTLVFSMSPLNQADRKTATSGSPETYVRLDIEALRHGELKGVFLGGTSIRPQALVAKKKATLPKLSSFKSIGIDPKQVRGTYQFKLQNGLILLFWFDMVGAVPVVTVNDGNKGLHLIDGPKWDGHGGFSVTDAFGDFMPVTSGNLIQMRGSVQKLGELQIYYVDPQNGIQGPLTAVRQQ